MVPSTQTIEFDPTNLQPLNAYFLIKLRGERQTKSGIVVGDAFVTNHCQGTIVAMDPNLRTFEWVQEGIKDLRIGDRVQFAPNNKYDVPRIEGGLSEHVLVPVQSIIGKYVE